MTRKIRLIYSWKIGDDLDLGQFTVWNQVTDAMKWRRGRYGREGSTCSSSRSGHRDGNLDGLPLEQTDLGLEFENSDAKWTIWRLGRSASGADGLGSGI